MVALLFRRVVSDDSKGDSAGEGPMSRASQADRGLDSRVGGGCHLNPDQFGKRLHPPSEMSKSADQARPIDLTVDRGPDLPDMGGPVQVLPTDRQQAVGNRIDVREYPGEATWD